MTALPSFEECGFRETRHINSLWNTLLQVEDTALKDSSRDPLIGIRVLGFFLKDFWDHACDGYLGYIPYNWMINKITSCCDKWDDQATYNALVVLGLRYHNHLLRVCELHNYLPQCSKCTK